MAKKGTMQAPIEKALQTLLICNNTVQTDFMALQNSSSKGTPECPKLIFQIKGETPRQRSVG
jgi:hypothetical protein